MTEYSACHDTFVLKTDRNVSYIAFLLTAYTYNKTHRYFGLFIARPSSSRAGIFYLLHDKWQTRGNAGTQSQCPHSKNMGRTVTERSWIEFEST